MEDRLACLEFYCRLRPPSPGCDEAARALFSVETDHRKRTFLRLVPDKWETDVKPRQWRCSYAMPAKAPTEKLCQTLGNEVLDWVLDGYNALVLGMGAKESGKSFSLFGDPRSSSEDPPPPTTGSTNISETSKKDDRQCGLVYAFLREIFRAKRSGGFRVGLSWWDVRGSEVRDQNKRPVFRNITKFEVLEPTSFQEATRVVDDLRLRPSKGSANKSRHLFFRVALFHEEDNLLSTVHFVDLGNENDSECRRDLLSLHQLLRDVAGEDVMLDHRSGATDADGPNALLRSPVSPQFQSERQLGALLMPLVTGNCKTFLLNGVLESQMSELTMQETIKNLDTAERASLLATTCRRIYLRSLSDVDIVPLAVGWQGFPDKLRTNSQASVGGGTDRNSSADTALELRAASADLRSLSQERPTFQKLADVDANISSEDIQRVRRYAGDEGFGTVLNSMAAEEERRKESTLERGRSFS
ncbi:unnamed protein product, partial [Amoebophrya sp. A25]|eukprot:GSA25T00020509001.1